MAVADQFITSDYAMYLGDCCEVLTTLPKESVHLSLYSPPFSGLFQYSSSERDMSNCLDRNQFFTHYEFMVRELHRLTLPGRMTAVHCMEIPSGNTGTDHQYDLPGDILRLHEKCGFRYCGRYCVWKEPLRVRNKTMAKNLAHKTIVQDSSRCSAVLADYLLIFRRTGENKIPVAHPTGLMDYAGFLSPPSEVLKYRGWKGSQIENRYSQWVWRQYASAFWSDVRPDRCLPFKAAKEQEDEKHIHPLQLDVIERAVVLWTNPGEVVLSPFAGVGSEVYGAVLLGRKGVGVELKPTYYRQALRNVAEAVKSRGVQKNLFEEEEPASFLVSDQEEKTEESDGPVQYPF